MIVIVFVILTYSARTILGSLISPSSLSLLFGLVVVVHDYLISHSCILLSFDVTLQIDTQNAFPAYYYYPKTPPVDFSSVSIYILPIKKDVLCSL